MAKGTDKNRKNRHSSMVTTKAGKKSSPKPPVNAVQTLPPTIGNVMSVLSQFHAFGIVLEAGYRDEVIIRARVAKGTERAAASKITKSFANAKLITS